MNIVALPTKFVPGQTEGAAIGVEGGVTVETLIAAAIPARKPCGVYFLLHEGEVVYVGQSVNIFGRVSSHISQTWMVFDSFAWIPVPRDELLYEEAAYIVKFRPKLNASMKKRDYQANRPDGAA